MMMMSAFLSKSISLRWLTPIAMNAIPPLFHSVKSRLKSSSFALSPVKSSFNFLAVFSHVGILLLSGLHQLHYFKHHSTKLLSTVPRKLFYMINRELLYPPLT